MNESTNVVKINSRPFFGGVPVGPDVERIEAAFQASSLKPGDRIQYHDIKKIIGVGPEKSRFKTVTAAWRRKLRRDKNIILGCDGGSSFFVMTDSEKLELGKCRKDEASRKLSDGVDLFMHRIDKSNLNDDQKNSLDFELSRAGKMIAASQIKPQVKLPEI